MKRFGALEIIAFVTGACLMMYELAAARLLAPTIGSSTYVWTSVIGVIIAALSLGYYAGGRIADMRAQARDVSWLLLMSAIGVVFTLTAYQSVLSTSADLFTDARVQAVLVASVLFAPTSFLLGVISPYLAKLNVRSLHTSGRAVASLSAFNSIGGIVGTFVTGFVLFGFVGSEQTVGSVALLLVAVSWLLVPRRQLAGRLAASLGVISVVMLVLVVPSSKLTVDTPSAHYTIIEGEYDGRPIRGITTGPAGVQSALLTNGSSQPVFWYTQQMAQLTLQRSPQRILMLGGGAFTLPQYLAEQLPGAQIDVVEIDPQLKEISERYFHYQNPSNVRLIFDDARRYINRSTQQYDVILVDVYGDGDIPFSFMTKEYGAAIAKRLLPGGVVLVNVIAGKKEPCRQVLSAVDAAYRHALPYALYRNQTGGEARRTNYVFVFSRQPEQQASYRPLPASSQPAYTDNFAPAERLYYACHEAA